MSDSPLKRKTFFKDQTFFRILVGYISALILWNIFIAVRDENFWTIVPIFIQIVLLILIFTRSEYARIVIITWAVICLIGANCLSLLSYLFDFGNNLIDKESSTIRVTTIVVELIYLMAGILIGDFTKRTTKVEFPADEDLEEIQS